MGFRMNVPGLWVRIGIGLGAVWVVVSLLRIVDMKASITAKVELIAYSAVIGVALILFGLAAQWIVDYLERKKQDWE